MRILVFFDLPTHTRADRRHAARFRKRLLKDGYWMIQFSVYGRVCKGMDSIDKHIARLQGFLPPSGNVRSMTITEKQYQDMTILLGRPSKNDEVGVEQLVLF